MIRDRPISTIDALPVLGSGVGSDIDPVEVSCRKCSRTGRLILGDGPAICRVCVMAWGALAAVVTSGDVVPEPDRAMLAHREHRVPRLGCVWCHGEARWSGSLSGWPPRGGRRGL